MRVSITSRFNLVPKIKSGLLTSSGSPGEKAPNSGLMESRSHSSSELL